MNDTATNQFESHRALMFSIAYRMLSSATEAEDIVQEAYIRYQGASLDNIQSHKAFLSTIITRLCLNRLQSAQIQRETYIGPWLPEPVLTESRDLFAPVQQAELHDSLSLAFLTLLEQLTPPERAVFLLREVFDYGYAEIAAIMDKDDAACRQLFSRAKKHIAENRPRFKPTPEKHRQLLNQFIETIGTGELNGLMQLLAEDVTMWADGGGKTRGAALHPLHGCEAVAQFVLASVHFAPDNLRAEMADVNGEPSIILRTESKPFILLSIAVQQEHISEIRVVSNPDKLKWVAEHSSYTPQGDQS